MDPKEYLLFLKEQVRRLRLSGVPESRIRDFLTEDSVERLGKENSIAGPASLEIALEHLGVAPDGELSGLTAQESRDVSAVQTDVVGGAAGAFATSAADIGAFGAADEAAGGLAGLAQIRAGRPQLAGQTFQDVSQAARGQIAAGRAQHPVAAGLGTGVGAVATGKALTAIPALAASSAAPRAVGAGRQAIRALGRTGAAGAAGGGLFAFNTAEGGLGERARAVPGGAAVGGVAGLALGTAGLAAGGALSAGASLRRRFGSGRLNPASRRAREAIQQPLDAANLSPEEAVLLRQQMGPEATFADIDQNFAAAGGAAAEVGTLPTRKGGPVEQLRARAADAGERFSAKARKLMGLGSVDDFSIAAARNDADEAVRQIADAHYGPLETSGVEVPGGAIDDLVGPRGAFKFELDKMLRRVFPGRKQGGVPSQSGRSVSVGDPLSFTQAQELTILLRQRKNAARRAGLPEEGRRFGEAAEALEDVMSDAFPEFRAANAAYRTSIARAEAFDIGQRAMAQKNPTVLRDAYAKLAGLPESREALRLGALEGSELALLSQTGRRQGASALTRMGRNEREKFLIMFDGDEDALKAFADFAAQEGERFALTEQFVFGGSPTSMRQEVRRSLLGPEPLQSGGNVLSRVTNGVLNRLLATFSDQSTRAAAADEMGTILLSRGEDAAVKFLQLMKRGRSLEEASAAVLSRIAQPAGAGILGAFSNEDISGLFDKP